MLIRLMKSADLMRNRTVWLMMKKKVHTYYNCELTEMPQGKMKVKTKGSAPPTKKSKPNNLGGRARLGPGGGVQKNGLIKKGKFNINPKKQVK
jgi:hypothetical protein